MVAILRVLRGTTICDCPCPPSLELPPPCCGDHGPRKQWTWTCALAKKGSAGDMVPGVGPIYIVAPPVDGAWRKERRGNTGKVCTGSWQVASQQWLVAFPGAEVTAEERSSMQAAVPSKVMYSFPKTQGNLAADPCALASSAKAGGCVRPPPCQVVGDEWSHVV